MKASLKASHRLTLGLKNFEVMSICQADKKNIWPSKFNVENQIKVDQPRNSCIYVNDIDNNITTY